jgi:fatty-acyl-CoA synthase
MTHGSLLNSVNLSTQNVGVEFSGSNSICVPIPFFHIYGFSTGLLLPLIGKSKQVFPFYFPETLSTIKSVEKYKCNWLRGTPTQFFDLISHPERKKHDLSSLKSAVIAGSTVPSDLLKKMLEELKVEDIVVGYGMTETSLCHSQTTVLDKFKSDEYAYQTCGRPIPWTESKIVDPNTGQIQPLNVDGELYIRGPHLIKQYWDEPEKTSDTIDKNGWYYLNKIDCVYF